MHARAETEQVCELFTSVGRLKNKYRTCLILGMMKESTSAQVCN